MIVGFNGAYKKISNGNKYRSAEQAWIDSCFEDTTLLRDIEEQPYPYSDNYEWFNVHMDSVSDVSVNTKNVRQDFRELIYQDCEHFVNRGQKIKYNNNVYLCYEGREELSKICRIKIVKCNNVLTFLKNGQIIKEPCFVGYELSATNNAVSKDSTIKQNRLVCFVQYNEYTKDFVDNQRFLLTKNKAFKITDTNDLNKEFTFDTEPKAMEMMIEWSAIDTTNDNTDLLIADYYNYHYTVEINSAELSLINGSSGQLTAVVKLDNEIQDIPVQWSTSDSNVIKIDSQGNYQVVGLSGSTALITASTDMSSDSINVSVVESEIDNKEILINPIKTRICLNLTKKITYGVYNNDVLTSDTVTVTASGADPSCYELKYDGNIVTVKNLKQSSKNLILTFKSDGLEDNVCTIELGGIM